MAEDQYFDDESGEHPRPDQFYSNLYDAADRLERSGLNKPRDWKLTRRGADWLPFDEVLITLAERQRAPKLLDETQLPPRLKLGIDACGGIHGFARVHVGIALRDAGMQGWQWSGARTENARTFIDRLNTFKDALLELTDGGGTRSLVQAVFDHGLSPEKRAERYKISLGVEQDLIFAFDGLLEMEKWAWDEYEAFSPVKGGRPRVGWKHEFVLSMAHFWQLVTGRRASASPNSLFVEFVYAAWASADMEPRDTPWEGTIRAALAKDDKTEPKSV